MKYFQKCVCGAPFLENKCERYGSRGGPLFEGGGKLCQDGVGVFAK